MTNFDSVDSPWARVFTEADGQLGVIKFTGLNSYKFVKSLSPLDYLFKDMYLIQALSMKQFLVRFSNNE